MLAGVGVAYKLAQALLRVAQHNRNNQPSLDEEALLDLVALGTVADLAPLNRLENRAPGTGVVWRPSTRRNGLGCAPLLEVAGVQPGKAAAMSIGYSLGPRINAAGRLGSAMTAFHLLTASDPAQAEKTGRRVAIAQHQTPGFDP